MCWRPERTRSQGTVGSSCGTTTFAERILGIGNAHKRRGPMKRHLGSFGILSALVGLLVLTGSAPAWAEDGVTDKEGLLGAGPDLTSAVANWGANRKAGMEGVFNGGNEARRGP